MFRRRNKLDISFLPKIKQKEINDLSIIFKEIDKKIASVKKKTAIDCVSNCGECCRTSNVTVAVIEMQPIAAYLLNSENIEDWIKKIDPKDEAARCVFYSDEVLANGGHCHVYELRPLLCRLFGFTSRIDKHNNKEIMICKKIRDHYVKEIKAKEKFLRSKPGLPISSIFTTKVYSSSFNLSHEQININLAFLSAVNIVGYYKDISDSDDYRNNI